MTTAKAQSNTYHTITYEEKHGELKGIAVVTFNRPKVLNAINQSLMEELLDVLEHVQKSHAVKVLVLTGTGDKAFIAGADISQFEKMTSKEAIAFAKFGQKVFTRLEELPQPTIAAVNGYALGGGCELALACDFIYAGENAQLGQPEVNLGILPGWGGTQRLTRLVGKAMAKELIFTGKLIYAHEAQRIGIVNKVCHDVQLMEDVLKTAKLIVSKGPIAVAQAKRAIEDGYHKELRDALELEAEAFAKTFDTQDQKEGAKAFLAKRPPQFVGR
ncbi:MAG: enoyl-CoA hydratase/isomerase family protein [Deltaproteobacteria bacterium]|nr:enoyl-CoA hydratase/isomerase family protein [Deltaproteobacteria bacterium]